MTIVPVPCGVCELLVRQTRTCNNHTPVLFYLFFINFANFLRTISILMKNAATIYKENGGGGNTVAGTAKANYC